MENRNLKSCPFCGGGDVYVMEEGFLGSPAVTCGGCRTVLGYPTADSTEEAVERWNTRKEPGDDR